MYLSEAQFVMISLEHPLIKHLERAHEYPPHRLVVSDHRQRFQRLGCGGQMHRRIPYRRKISHHTVLNAMRFITSWGDGGGKKFIG